MCYLIEAPDSNICNDLFDFYSSVATFSAFQVNKQFSLGQKEEVLQEKYSHSDKQKKLKGDLTTIIESYYLKLLSAVCCVSTRLWFRFESQLVLTNEGFE